MSEPQDDHVHEWQAHGLVREQKLVVRMLGGAVTPMVFHLADDTLEARLTVDPDIAFEAIQRREATR